VAVLLTYLASSAAIAPPACDGGAAELASAWPASTPAALERAFTRALAAPETASSIQRGLESYRASWLAGHRAACLDHRRGAQSAQLLDRRMLCLRRSKDALAAARKTLVTIDAAALARAREVVANLPPLADCADADLLLAAVAPPAAAVRAQVAKLEGELAQAVASEHLGRLAEALAQVRALAPAAATTAYDPLIGNLGLAEGRILLTEGAYVEAGRVLVAAEHRALELGLVAQGIEAAARRIYVQAMVGADLPGLVRQAEVYEPLSRSLRGDRFARPLLLNNLGVVHMAMGQREAARVIFAQASALVAVVPEPEIELTAIDHNLAMLTRDDEPREALIRAVWERRRRLLGDQHLSTIEALLSYGKFIHEPARALPVVLRACEGYTTYHPSALEQRSRCDAYKAFLLSTQGAHAASADAYERIAEDLHNTDEESLQARAKMALAMAALVRGRHLRARSGFGEILAATRQATWWNRSITAIAHAGIAQAMLPGEDPSQRRRHLQLAIPVFEGLAELNEDGEFRLRLDLARKLLDSLIAH
jgi:tetratricopeptide (TPR) repeat protein